VADYLGRIVINADTDDGTSVPCPTSPMGGHISIIEGMGETTGREKTLALDVGPPEVGHGTDVFSLGTIFHWHEFKPFAR